MRQISLGAWIRVQKYHSYKGVFGKIAHNHLQRKFDADRPNHRWLTDITEFKVGDNKLYLSPILDCYHNEIVSYSVSRRPTYELVSTMLDKTLTNRKVSLHEPLMLHSDQGWHYQMRPFTQKLKEHKIQQSMSRKGNCLDNALIESFFGTLKCETIYIDKPKTIEALEKKFMSTFITTIMNVCSLN